MPKRLIAASTCFSACAGDISNHSPRILYSANLLLKPRSIREAIDAQLRVGGPSTAGAAWVPEFLAHAKATNTPVDFVTTHTYGVDHGYLDEFGVEDRMLSRAYSYDALGSFVLTPLGLVAAGLVTLLDLYASGFAPAMSAAERNAPA